MKVIIELRRQNIFLVLVFGTVFLLQGCIQDADPNGKNILKRAINVADPDGQWRVADLQLHIQEPRPRNPQRYSLVYLNNATNEFTLHRNRERHISEHRIDAEGKSLVLLDGKSVNDSALITKYRLDPARNIGYKNFYHLLIGLPMSLETAAKEIGGASVTRFNDEECYKIEIKLEQSVISDQWNVYINTTDFSLVGVEIVAPDRPDGGERLYFDGQVIIGNMSISRVRHWHQLSDDAYSGSDVIVKTLN